MSNVQQQALVLPLLGLAAQLHESCLPHFSRLVGDAPFDIKTHGLWSLLQQLSTVVVNFYGCVCIDDRSLHGMESGHLQLAVLNNVERETCCHLYIPDTEDLLVPASCRFVVALQRLQGACASCSQSAE